MLTVLINIISSLNNLDFYKVIFIFVIKVFITLIFNNILTYLKKDKQ